jgi:hypothetical protein
MSQPNRSSWRVPARIARGLREESKQSMVYHMELRGDEARLEISDEASRFRVAAGEANKLDTAAAGLEFGQLFPILEGRVKKVAGAPEMRAIKRASGRPCTCKTIQEEPGACGAWTCCSTHRPHSRGQSARVPCQFFQVSGLQHGGSWCERSAQYCGSHVRRSHSGGVSLPGLRDRNAIVTLVFSNCDPAVARFTFKITFATN